MLQPELAILILLTATAGKSVTLEDFFHKQCAEGNASACERQQAIADGKNLQQILDSRAESFWQEVDTELLLLDGKRPDLKAAYPLVMHDYAQAGQNTDHPVSLNEDRLPQCARHYHNHWLNKKLWYPSHDDGTPDWPAIYVFIVDHYYGYCLRSDAGG